MRGMALSERRWIWVCEYCGYVTNHGITNKRYFCSGSQSGPDALGPDQGDHPASECQKLAVVPATREQELREALEFYAAAETWEWISPMNQHTGAYFDQGERARAALTQKED